MAEDGIVWRSRVDRLLQESMARAHLLGRGLWVASKITMVVAVWKCKPELDMS